MSLGLYTDCNFRLKIIMPYAYDDNKRIVYSSEEYDDHNILELNEKLCMIGNNKGFVNNDKINWISGDVWQKLEISSLQISILKYRSYTPITLVFFACIANIIYEIFQYFRFHKAKTVNVYYSRKSSS